MLPTVNPFNFAQMLLFLVVENYVVAYRVNETHPEVLILRAVHGRRNWQNEM